MGRKQKGGILGLMKNMNKGKEVSKETQDMYSVFQEKLNYMKSQRRQNLEN